MSHYNKNNRYTDYQSQSRSYKHSDYQEGYDSNQYEESSAESKILLLRGLKPTTTEEIIVDTVKVYAPIEEVKIVRDRSTGESRGFAFVEFPSIQDAKSLLQYTSGHIQIEGSTVYLSYSYQQQQQQQQSYSTSHHQQQQHSAHHQHHRANESKEPNWLCSQCGGNNFGWRNACFQCRVPKGDNVQTVSTYTGESSPTSIICVRGLEFSTNEQTLWTTFTGYSGVKDVRLVRDRITLTSRGFCFVEFHTVEDSINFMNIANNTIRVDGRLVKMVYSKGKGEESSSIQAKNRPPLVIQDAATIIKSKDLSLFVYDPTYGYYFHSGSGLYYNPNENYYWDSINQIQYKYDNISQDYLPPSNINTTASSTTSTSTTTTDTNSSQDTNTTNSDTKVEGTTSSGSNSALEAIQKSEQSKTKETGSGILLNKKISITLPTKKVSKDIEKWGKKNKELVESIKAEPLELDLVQNKKKKSNTSNNDDNSNSSSNAGSESPSRSSNEGTDSSNNSIGGIGNDKVDWTKYVCDPELEQTVGNVCLLCKRQFGSIDTLKKHQALSDLHKQNLEIARQKLNARIKDKLAHQDELNTASSSSSSSSKGKTPKPQDFTVGVGGKLLEKMGWKKGEGIGKQNVVTSVIDVEIRPERAGLGSIDSGNHAVVAGDDWRTAVKKRARARFDSMNLEEEDAAKRGKS